MDEMAQTFISEIEWLAVLKCRATGLSTLLFLTERRVFRCSANLSDTRVKISQVITELLAQHCQHDRTGLVNNSIAQPCFNILYTAWRQELFGYVRICKIRLDTTTKFMVVVTSLFNLVISSFPDNMFYHIHEHGLIYHDGTNNVVQVCLFIKS